MGRAASELERLNEAGQHFLRAAEVNPLSVEPLFDLAKLRFRQGRTRDADQILDQARAMRPRDPATLHNIAEALRTQGRHEEAVANYHAALEIDAEFAPSHAGLGIAYFEWGRHEEAIDALEQALSLQDDLPIAGSSPYVFLGRAALNLGRPEAVDYFSQALQNDPHDHEALDHLAMVRFGEQRYEEARALYHTMAELQPDNAVTHSNLGATLYHLGRFDEALASIERSLALEPELEMARVGHQLVIRELARQEQ
jgi:tetratricopeptide (TPR) repeat protein